MKLATRTALGFFCILIGFYLLSVAALYVFQRDMMYKPPAPGVMENEIIKSYDAVSIATEGAPDLPSYYAPAKNGKPTLLAFHGNGENANNPATYLDFLRQAGYGILLAEYRGYGGNTGQTTKEGIYTDSESALKWLNGQGIPNTDIVLFGLSLGSAPVSYLAAQDDAFLGAILVVPFSRMSDLAQSYYPLVPFLSVLLKDDFDNAAYLQDSTVPKLIIAASQDEIVPNRFARELFEQAASPKVFATIPEAGHLNVITQGGGSEILRFLAGQELTR